ncbi:MAG TPA: toll/interleukin-1 receptor domain-containing protein [Phycisphaerae bacterium]|nr:toll/interleukin-1 receptor domain-containing protein [Phycisphaerae bacterium]
MPVFISHRTADNEIAQRVAHRLKYQHGITVYIDDIDQELRRLQGTSAITGLLVRRLNSCTNLLAIVSRNTHGSWWVPFEIGVARQCPRVITTMTDLADSLLPEYLLEWPRLRGETAVDIFARLYKEQKQVLTEQVLEKRASDTVQAGYVDRFHRSLKSALDQR